MNERIKELAQQAEMAANNGDHVDVKIMMEKFAELLIRECGKIADIAEPWRSGDLILDYFGIQHDTRQRP